MEGAEAAIEENLSCSICTEVLTDPKTLQCLHNFCASCLQEYLNLSARLNTHVSGIKCPNCREETQVPDPSRQVSQWVSQLRTNCIIRNTIEQGLHRPSDKDCDICRDDDRNIQAVVQCSTCQLTFCQPCLRVHKMIPACREHYVKRIASIPPIKYECYNFNISLETNSSSSRRKKMSQRVKEEISSKIDVICKRGVEDIKNKEKQLTADTDAVLDEVFEKFDSLYPVLSADERSDHSSLDDSDEEDGKEVVTTIKLSSKVESFINSGYGDSLASARATLDFKETEDLGFAPL
ncbi:tripartite motif containing 13-like [Haliotis rubra]|uniref:tripartite motif containing 13-like n=1 Tax=Haliotis rubra TaxID=36100 RepID=UPI001EE57EB7|nr:tripartite motif containing 13-like [Haliotis rubra]XP_046584073.1 tripartite motif containing 13-like [Haliotis rubra]